MCKNSIASLILFLFFVLKLVTKRSRHSMVSFVYIISHENRRIQVCQKPITSCFFKFLKRLTSLKNVSKGYYVVRVDNDPVTIASSHGTYRLAPFLKGGRFDFPAIRFHNVLYNSEAAIRARVALGFIPAEATVPLHGKKSHFHSPFILGEQWVQLS
jgi:hypothetical protein